MPEFPLRLVVSPMLAVVAKELERGKESWNNIEAAVLGAF
jgi:hypothetical protein